MSRKVSCLFLLLICLFCVTNINAQSTNVSATITDASSQAWVSGTYKFSFVPVFGNNGPYIWTGGAFSTGTVVSGSLDGTGSFTNVSVPSNTAITPAQSQWKLTVCPNGSGACYSINLTITGASQTVTSSVIPPAISIPAGVGNQIVAYTDAEISGPVEGTTYFNFISGGNRTFHNGVWAAGSGGGITSVQTLPNLPCTPGAQFLVPDGVVVTCNQAGTAFVAPAGPFFNAAAWNGVQSNSDNSVAFAAMATAVTNASLVSTGPIAIHNSNTCVTATTATSLNCPINIFSGDTVIVNMSNSQLSRTFTITDNGTGGGNNYTRLNPAVASGSAVGQIYASIPKVGLTATQITATDSGAAEAFTISVATYTGVGSYGAIRLSATGSSTAPSSGANSTQDNGNFMVTGLTFFSGGTNTLTANVGNLRTTVASSASEEGAGIIDGTSASPGSVTNSGTLAPTSNWVAQTVELRSFTPVTPTVYFPYGTYNYASGLTFTKPVHISCEPGGGTRLIYNGIAHEMDLGPTGLAAPANNALSSEYSVDGCTFTGGQFMTEGIFVNQWNIETRFSRNNFYNNGNTTACSIWADGFNWRIIVENNWGNDDDNISRPKVCIRNLDPNSRLYLVGNTFGCIAVIGTNTCTSPNAAVTSGGTASLIENNRIEGYAPNLTIPVAGNDTIVRANYFENPAPSGGTASVQLGETSGTGNVDGLLVDGNYFNQHSSGSPFSIGSGTELVVNSRFLNNNFASVAPTTAVVTLNNLTGQTGNVSSNNKCSSGVPVLPCALLHTAGGNIAQWNADAFPPLTFAAGTTASYPFLQTYSVAPKCVIPPNITGTATTLTITTLNTTTLTITASAANSATVTASCNADAQ